MQDNYTQLRDPQPQPLLAALHAQVQNYIFDRENQNQHDNLNSNSNQLQQKSKYKKPAFLVDDMNTSYIDLKKSFEYVGDNSTFQKRITSILMIQWIAFSYMVNSMAFLFRSPNFTCRIPLTDLWIPCHATEACKYLNTGFVKVNFQNSSSLNFYQVSITEQFNLICQKQAWAPFAQSIFFLGGFISGYLFSYISGKIGRRSILMLIMVMIVCSIMVCAFAVDFWMFLIGYFFVGFSMFGYETSIYIYIGEISAIRFRTISINMLTMVWAGTPLFLPVLSLIPSWKYAFIFFSAIILITIPFCYKFFLQSPIFLVSKNCYSQARDIFCQISTTNKRPPYSFRLLQQLQSQNQFYLKYTNLFQDALTMINHSLQHKKQSKEYSFTHLFRYPSLRSITLILMYWWMFRFFMYFGLNLALQSILHSGLVLSMVIAGAAVVEVMGSFGISLLTTILYRKYKLDVMRVCLIVMAACCFCMWFLRVKIECKNLSNKNYQVCIQLILMILLVVIIKFFNTVFFSGLIVYYAEVYPTPVRSLGCGFTLTFGRLGTIIVPFYINYMKMRYVEKNSLSFLAPFGLLAFGLSFFMPYTELGVRENVEEELHEEIQMK